MTHCIDRIIEFEVSIPAEMDAVWEAWTTEEGVKSFFAPECRIELHPGGAYEMYFDLDAESGLRGGEGCRILAIEQTSNVVIYLEHSTRNSTTSSAKTEHTCNPQASTR